MALFRLTPPREAATFIRGDGVFMRPAKMDDYEAWASLRERSREFLAPWEPIWPADDLTKGAFRRRIKRHSEEMARDEAFPLLLLTVYAKNQKANLTKAERNDLKKLVPILVRNCAKGRLP